MNFTKRQQQIIDIVRRNEPVTGTDIANELGYSKSTIRSDLALLTHVNILDAKPKVGYIVNKNQDKNKINMQVFDRKVKDLKSEAVCVDENLSLHDAIIQIFTRDAGTIFVTSAEGFLNGVVSRKDFLKSILGNVDIHHVPVSVIMTRMPNIITTADDESIVIAAKKIIEHKFDALPVVEKITPTAFKITGRLSKTTLSKLFVELTDN